MSSYPEEQNIKVAREETLESCLEQLHSRIQKVKLNLNVESNGSVTKEPSSSNKIEVCIQVVKMMGEDIDLINQVITRI